MSSKAAQGKKVRVEVPPNHSSTVQRETVESIVIAVILAFLFRAFVAEAFIIPTGSMAPTLMGKHKDLLCPKCGYAYRAGASSEDSEAPEIVVSSMCPMCRYNQPLDIFGDLAHDSFSGDRILVSKFTYDMESPQRWDVIVFKWPNNAKQNYIKRLIGLPNEEIRIFNGDIFYRKPGDKEFAIARKPPHKILAMLQDVHDSNFIAKEIHDAGLPIRWRTDSSDWSIAGHGKSLSIKTSAGDPRWIHYQHVLATQEDWNAANAGAKIDGSNRIGQLISDFYAYNAHSERQARLISPKGYDPTKASDPLNPMKLGLFWVGDLAIECDVDIKSADGKLLFDLVEAGRHHVCEIDVKTGEATLQIDSGQHAFGEGDDDRVKQVKGKTQVKGTGQHSIRFANLDNELTLWVDDRVIQFDGPTTYEVKGPQNPRWSTEDPGDLNPVRIGGQGVEFAAENLKVLRDIYYIASSNQPIHEYQMFTQPDSIQAVFADPKSWETTPLFDSRGAVEFLMEEGQFFPLGDNSPHSYDARSWDGVRFVERKLMIGKALLVYWPHPLHKPVPFFPNFGRMGLIR